MAKLSDRSQTLKDFGLTESTLQALFINRDPADALWLNDHELEAHIEWAKRRHAFIKGQIEEAHPSLVVMKRTATVGPPIVSHRGRTSDTSVYGEQRG